MKYGITLIDKAAEKCGSYYKLALACGLHESTISAIRSGKRNLPAKHVPKLAELAGQDAADWLWKVMQENEPKPERRGEITSILGKGIAAGVAAMCLFSYSSESISGALTMKQSADFVKSLYIVECVTAAKTWTQKKFRAILTTMATTARTIKTVQTMWSLKGFFCSA